MKKLLIGLLALGSMSSFANCTDAGKAKAENEVVKQLRQMGVTEDIKIYTNSSFSNIYSTSMHCTYETLYSFDAIDTATDKVRSFLGRSITNNEGQKPLPDLFQQGIVR